MPDRRRRRRPRLHTRVRPVLGDDRRADHDGGTGGDRRGQDHRRLLRRRHAPERCRGGARQAQPAGGAPGATRRRDAGQRAGLSAEPLLGSGRPDRADRPHAVRRYHQHLPGDARRGLTGCRRQRAGGRLHRRGHAGRPRLDTERDPAGGRGARRRVAAEGRTGLLHPGLRGGRGPDAGRSSRRATSHATARRRSTTRRR